MRSRVLALLLLSSPAHAQTLDGFCAGQPSGTPLGNLMYDLDGAFAATPKLSNVTVGFEITIGSTKYSASGSESVETTCAGVTVETTSEVKVGRTKDGKVPDLFGAKLAGEAGAGFATTS